MIYFRHPGILDSDDMLFCHKEKKTLKTFRKKWKQIILFTDVLYISCHGNVIKYMKKKLVMDNQKHPRKVKNKKSLITFIAAHQG